MARALALARRNGALPTIRLEILLFCTHHHCLPVLLSRLLVMQYFVMTTAATVGFGDFRPSSVASKALTCALALVGTGLIGGLLAGLLGELGAVLEQQQPLPPRQPVSQEDEAWREVRLHWRRALSQGGALLAVGMVGFKALEGRQPGRAAPTWADALYLAIGTLTSSGIGDVVPSSRGARTFIAIYSVLGTLTFARVVGVLALRPLERARREAQRAVLDQYTSRGRLTQRTLEELARGALIKRLALSVDDSCCSRDEFTLLTLVEMGKVTESDLAECRAAFDALDADKSGWLGQADLDLLRRQRSAKARDLWAQRTLARARHSSSSSIEAQ